MSLFFISDREAQQAREDAAFAIPERSTGQGWSPLRDLMALSSLAGLGDPGRAETWDGSSFEGLDRDIAAGVATTGVGANEIASLRWVRDLEFGTNPVSARASRELLRRALPTERTDWERYFVSNRDAWERERRANTIDPTTRSDSANLVGGLASIFASFGSGGAAFGPAGPVAAGVGMGAAEEQNLLSQGVDPETARRGGQFTGLTMTAMGFAPVALPGRVLQRMATGAGINLAFGATLRGGMNNYLTERGYGEGSENNIAQNYQWLDPHAATIDVVLGAAFGGLFGRRAPSAVRPHAGPDGIVTEVGPEPVTLPETAEGFLEEATQYANDEQFAEAYAYALLARDMGHPEADNVIALLEEDASAAELDAGRAMAEEVIAEDRMRETAREQLVTPALVEADTINRETALGVPVNQASRRWAAEAQARAEQQAANDEAIDVGPMPGGVDFVDLHDVEMMASEIEYSRRALRDAPQGLANWVRRRGISDDRGDIRGMDDRGRGAAAMIAADGRPIDQLIEAAVNDGFFPEYQDGNLPDANTFRDALDRDIRDPGSVTNDDGAAFSLRNARDILRHYEQRGIDTSLRGDALRQEVRRISAEGLWDEAIDAFEQEALANRLDDLAEDIRQLREQRPDVVEPREDGALFSVGRRGAERRSDGFYDERLSPQQNKAVEMARNNYSNAEIADEMDISSAQVGVLLSQAKSRVSGLEIPPSRRGAPSGQKNGNPTATIEEIVSLYNRLARQGYRNAPGRAVLGRRNLNTVIAERLGVSVNSVTKRLSTYRADLEAGRTQGEPLFSTRRVLDTDGGEVIANPTQADMLRLTRPVRGKEKFETESLRYIQDAEGNIYVGRSYGMTHDDIAAALMDWGIEIPGYQMHMGDRYSHGDVETGFIHRVGDTLQGVPERRGAGARFSTGEGGVSNVAELEARAAQELGADLGALMRSGKAELVETASALPFAVPAEAQAVHYKGKSYFIADRISLEEIVPKILHEVGYHEGMEGLVGAKGVAEINRQIARMYAENHPLVREAVDFALQASAIDNLNLEAGAYVAERAQRAREGSLRKLSPEEQRGALAYLIELRPDMPLVQRILSRIRQWLIKTFGSTFGMRLTVDDLRALALASLRRVAEQARRDGAPEGVAEVLAAPRYSAADGPDAGQSGAGNRAAPFEFDSNEFMNRIAFPRAENVPEGNPVVHATPLQPDIMQPGNRQFGESGSKYVTINGEPVVRAEITRSSDGEITIQRIDTLDLAQRRGYARMLVDDLYAEFGPFRTTAQSSKGSELFRNYERRADGTYIPRNAPDGGASGQRPAVARQRGSEASALSAAESANTSDDVRYVQSAPREGGDVRLELEDGNGFMELMTSPTSWTVHSVELQPGARGWGFGVGIYEDAIARARASGAREFSSGSIVSEDAQHVWDALERRGYPVVRRVDEFEGPNFSIDLTRGPRSDAPNAGSGGDFPMFSFGGRRALTADESALVRAQERIKRGEDPELVRQETGWFRSEGEWKFEIDDSAAVWRDTAIREQGKLSDYLEHPALFAAYPQLKDVRVYVQDRTPENAAAHYDPPFIRGRVGYIGLNRSWLQRTPIDDVRSLILHETQHAVQVLERWQLDNGPYWDRWHEREARDVQARLRMTAEERQRLAPDVMDGARQTGFPMFSMGRQNAENLLGAKRDPIESQDYQQRLRALRESDGGQGRTGEAEGSRTGSVRGVAGEPAVRGDGKLSAAALQEILAVSGIHISTKQAGAGASDFGAYTAVIDTPFASEADAVLQAARGADGGPTLIDFDLIDGSNPKDTRLPGVHIRLSRLNDGAKGVKAGVWFYRHMIEWADRQGLPVYSDSLSVSKEAQNVYDALARRGYDVERLGRPKRSSDGSLLSTDGTPVYRVSRRGEIDEPLTGAPLPREDYQIDGPTLRQRQQRIDEQVKRQEEYDALSNSEQIARDKPSDALFSMGPRRGPTARDLLDAAEAETNAAAEMRKGMEAAARCAARHGAGAAVRGVSYGAWVPISGVAQVFFGQAVGAALAIPFGIVAAPYLGRSANPRRYTEERLRAAAESVAAAEARRGRDAAQAGRNAGLDAPTGYDDFLGQGEPLWDNVDTSRRVGDTAQEPAPDPLQRMGSNNSHRPMDYEPNTFSPEGGFEPPTAGAPQEATPADTGAGSGDELIDLFRPLVEGDE